MTILAGKRIVVTGAGSIGPGWGNGKAAAVAFSRLGAKVLCVDRNEQVAEETADIIRTEGGEVSVLAADITSNDAGDTVLNSAQDALVGWMYCTTTSVSASKGVPPKPLMTNGLVFLISI